MATGTEDKLGKFAGEYWTGHAKNAVASLTGGEVQPVRPWFGQGGYLEEARGSATPTATPQQAQVQDTATPTQQPPAPAPTSNNDAIVALTGTPKIKAATVEPQPVAEKFKATLPGGIVYEAGDQPGQRKFSVPGQMTATANGQFGFNDKDRAAILAKNALAGRTPVVTQRPVQQSAMVLAPAQQVDNGTGPAREKTPLEISMENSDRMKSNAANALAGGQPRYMTAAEGAAHGIGWKGRLAKYREDVDTYNKATGNQVAMDLEAMREAGAGGRALLHAKGVNDGNAIAMQRLIGENDVNAARIATEGINQQKGQLDINQAQNLTKLQQQYLGEKDPAKQRALGQQLLTMQGKDPKEWQITTREETDPANPMIPKKVSYAVNLQDPTRVVEIGGQGNRGPLPLPNEASQRKPGQVYMAPSGHLLQWDGKGLKPAQ